MAENSVHDLRKYFGTEDRPVTTSEMMEFWKALTDEEKEYFRTAELS